MPIHKDYHILCSNKTGSRCVSTIMTYISEEEEYLIDNLKDKIFQMTRGNQVFNVKMNQIHCYGEVDFNNQEGLDTIDGFKFLDFLGGVGIRIYSRYNYTTHSCSSPKRHALWSETWSPAYLAKYAHGFLGKPKRIILFNQG